MQPPSSGFTTDPVITAAAGRVRSAAGSRSAARRSAAYSGAVASTKSSKASGSMATTNGDRTAVLGDDHRAPGRRTWSTT